MCNESDPMLNWLHQPHPVILALIVLGAILVFSLWGGYLSKSVECDKGCEPYRVIECNPHRGRAWCSDDKIHWNKR
jgi:hypothetical protein